MTFIDWNRAIRDQALESCPVPERFRIAAAPCDESEDGRHIAHDRWIHRAKLVELEAPASPPCQEEVAHRTARCRLALGDID